MHGQPHLERRGQVYQWRRKFGTISTKFVQVRLSLLTTDRAVAVKLARKTTAASECIVQELLEDRITKEEATRFLAATIRREKEKIETLTLLQHVDSLDPQDDALHDQAQREAWKFISTRGLNSAVPADIARDPEKARLASRIALLKADLRTPARHARIRDDFCDVTGRTGLSAVAFLRALELHIVGKSAAWNSENGTRHEIENLAAELAAQPVSSFAPAAPTSTMDEPELPVVLGHTGPEERTASHALAPELAQAAATPSLASDHPRTDGLGNEAEPPADPDIRAVVARMNEVKRYSGISKKTRQQYVAFADLFVLITNVSDVRRIRQTDAVKFRDWLLKLPKSWGKSPADRHATVAQIRARTKDLPPDKIGLAPGTINRHLEHLSQVLKYADSEEIDVSQRLSPEKLRVKDTVRPIKKKRAFKEGELREVFQSPIWSGSKSEYYQTQPGGKIFKNGVFWVPPILALTGARREEIAGLAIEDLEEKDGLLCFEIRPNQFRGLKSLASERTLPVHPRLIELGFLEYVQGIKASGAPDLFPDLLEEKADDVEEIPDDEEILDDEEIPDDAGIPDDEKDPALHGRRVYRKMKASIEETLGAKGAGLSLHSIRHYVKHTLDQYPDLRGKILRDIMGHESNDVHDGVYGDVTEPRVMLDALLRLPVFV